MVSLDVYVSSHCANCDYSRVLAQRAAQAFPSLQVRVLNLTSGIEPPEAVFATPTYVLNGQVVFLGNPDQRQLFALLDGATQDASP